MWFIFGAITKLLGLAATFGVLFLAIAVGIPYWLGPSDALEKSDAIVALSGGDTDARTQEAIRLYKDKWAPLIVFSGAAKDPNSPSNAEVMRAKALDQGVPSGNIEIEKFGADTIGNAEGTAQILRAKGVKKIILVTSKYHQRRAYFEFRHHLGPNIQIVNHPAPHDKRWPTRSWWLHPDSLWLGFTESIKTAYVWARER